MQDKPQNGIKHLMRVLAIVPPLAVQAGTVPVVADGEAGAVVVTAAEPSPIAVQAARELIEHLAKATGAKLSVIAENDPVPEGVTRIYIGVTESAKALGVDADALPQDAFVFRAAGDVIHILGSEDPASAPLDRMTWGTTRSPHNGTLYGVYELLERHVGVRWLWPGDLGTFVPKADRVFIPETDELIEPALRYRRLRYPWLAGALRAYDPGLERLAFSAEGLKTYSDELHQFLHRHRMAYSLRSWGHYFGSWWGRYGQEHPEWFMMTEEGHRATPEDDRRFQRHGVPMCVSNPELHAYIVNHVWDGGETIPLLEVDVGEYCRCPTCMAWDGFQPEGARHRITSERYARFARTIHEMAAPRNPDVQVFTFLYMQYFPAPQSETEMSPNIFGWFTPWGGGNTVWYPATEERQAWKMKQWDGWARTGISMIYRPNDMLAGYTMPHINIRQRAAFFSHAHESGRMIGADFDSLMGQWAVRGPEHYMAARRLAHPHLSLEEVLDEYYSAFGPAAGHVRAYFDYWENHNHELLARGDWADMWARPNRDNDGRNRGAPLCYPPEVFPPARAILDQAMAAARAHPDRQFAERVEFLKTGLKHAILSADFVRRMEDDDPEAGEALRELIAFRKAHEHTYMSDYIRPAQIERRAYAERIDALLTDGEK